MKAMRWVPAPVLMFVIAVGAVLMMIFVGVPLLALFAAAGITMAVSFVWALISLAGVIFGQPNAIPAFLASVGYCAAALTASGLVFYYGGKLWRWMTSGPRPGTALTLRDEPFSAV